MLSVTCKFFFKTSALAILLLFVGIVGVQNVYAATGDITAVRIAGDTVHNGWTAEIDISGLSTGGTYAMGLGANNDPGGAKVVFTVNSPGYDSNGNATTITRTVYGTKFVRQTYPSNALADESESGGTLTVKVALSDFVYSGDSSITANIAPGFYTQGTANTASSGISVTNSSALAYPKVIGRWAWPGYERVTGDFLIEAVAFHRSAQNGKPLASMKFIATDQHGNSTTQTVADMTVSTRTGDANTVLVYAATMPVSTLTQGDLLTINFEAYPWVGDSTAVLNSATTSDGFAQPEERIGPLTAVNDKNGTFGIGYALVNSAGTTSTTTGAVVYASQAAAESAGNSTAFITIGRAAAAIQDYHRINFSRNDAGGGVILLTEGSYTFPGFTPNDLGSTTASTTNAWLIVKNASTAAKANTIISAGTNATFKAERLKIEGITLSASSGSSIIRGRAASDALWLHDTTINLTSTGPILVYKAVYATQNAVTAYSNGFGAFSTNKSPYVLIRGNTSTPVVTGNLYAIIGNKNINLSNSGKGFIETGNASGHRISDNSIYAFNTVYGTTGANLIAGNTLINGGIAYVQNVLESLSSSQPILQIAADSSTTVVNNVIIWNNTLAGQRTNFAYNEYTTDNFARFNWSQRFNSLADWNTKDDTFGAGPPNGVRQGSWPVTYNIGTVGNRSQVANFPGSFDGLFTNLQSTVSAPLYTLDKSYNGTAAGNGTYTLVATSTAIDLATSTSSTYQALPYDLLGNARYGASDSGAYEYQPPLLMGTDLISTSTIVRVYGDEKFRNKKIPTNAATANLSVSLAGSNTTDWLDISISTWMNTGTRQKTWTETSSTTALTNTVHTVGELSANTAYAVSMDGGVGTNITGASCTAGICTSNGSGYITFTYTGGYSTHTFDVLESVDTTAPTISAIASSTSSTSATISWTTNENSTSVLNYGLTSGYGTASTSSTLTTSHSLSLTGLTPSTLYHFALTSVDASSNSTTSSDYSFTTTATPDITAPVISSISATPNPTSIVITWNTDENATSQVVYSTDLSYNSTTTLGISLQTTHSMTLTGLTESTTYHFLVISKDASDNTSTSSDQTIQTTQLTAEDVSRSSSSYIRNFGNSTPAFNFTHDLQIFSQESDVKTLQTILVSKGYLQPQYITGYFGALTKQALSLLQRSVGITPAVGYFGPITRTYLNSYYSGAQGGMPVSNILTPPISFGTRTMQVGSTGEDVTSLQKFLIRYPTFYPDALVTGYFGTLTRDAVGAFQIQHMIISNSTDRGYGIVGPRTRAKIHELMQ